jgi:hypothetical protein
MMLLGLVIHSALTYAVKDLGNGWSLKDPNTTNLLMDFTVGIIHTFRMPIFFLVAGFFGAMLFYERKPLPMVRNRVARIVLPFIVFVWLLLPTIIFSFIYTNLVFGGSEAAFATALAYFSDPLAFIPPGTAHLWFLYYLAMITFTSVGLGLVMRQLPGVTNRISRAFSWVIQRAVPRLLVFAGFTTLIFSALGTNLIATSNSWVPNGHTFGFYLFFYLVGWVLFKSKHLLDSLKRFDGASTVLGLVLLIAQYTVLKSLPFAAQLAITSLVTWLLIFGITGLFLRYGSKHSARMRYVSDASYWVYLVHLPIAALLPSFIVDWPIPALLKFLIVLSSTGLICFVSYHYLVRGTFIGKFLNGRKYSRSLSDITE